MELHLSCTVEYYDARYRTAYTALAKKVELLSRHANPLALMVGIIGESIALVERHLLGILDPHVVGIDSGFNIRAVIRRLVALIKHRELAHRNMHLRKRI